MWCFMYLMILSLPRAVLAAVSGGGGAVTGEMSFPGITIWIVGITAAFKIVVYWDGFNMVDSCARPSAASA